MEHSDIHLSTTCMGCFKDCPMKFYYRYVKRLLPVTEADVLRYGTNWHAAMEIMSMVAGQPCTFCDGTDPMCPVCGGSKIVDDPDKALERFFAQTYASCPASKEPLEWAVERIKLQYCAAAYKWYYQADPMTVVAREIPFKVPFVNAGRKVRGVQLVGKIDKILSLDGQHFIMDHKSTSRTLAPDSTFWGHLTLDTQTLLYPYALRTADDLYNVFGKQGFNFGGIVYDAFHKPMTNPKALTQAASKEFMATGVYCGQKFTVTDNPIRVNGDTPLVEPGKKEGTFAITETPTMYGARLLSEIVADPTSTFVRRPVPRTERDLDNFHRELMAILGAIRMYKRNNLWFHNEHQCEATYKCDYIGICYNGVDVEKEIPAGFYIPERKTDARQTP